MVRKSFLYLRVIALSGLVSAALSLLLVPWLSDLVQMKARLSAISEPTLVGCSALLLLSLLTGRKRAQKFLKRYVNTWARLDAPPRSAVDYAFWVLLGCVLITEYRSGWVGELPLSVKWFSGGWALLFLLWIFISWGLDRKAEETAMVPNVESIYSEDPIQAPAEDRLQRAKFVELSTDVLPDPHRP